MKTKLYKWNKNFTLIKKMVVLFVCIQKTLSKNGEMLSKACLHKQDRGFTLIEVMISLLLFTVISLSMTNVIDQTTRAQKQIERLIKSNRALKNATYVIKKDIQSLIRSRNTPHWVYRSYVNYLRSKNQENFFDEHMSGEDQGFLYSTNFPVTGLFGSENSFYLTNYSKNFNSKIIRIHYGLENCPNKNSNKCLIRRISPIDNANVRSPYLISVNDLEEAFATFDSEETQVATLMEGIREINVEYFDSESQEWKDEFHFNFTFGVYYPPPLPLALKINILFESEANPALELYIPLHQSLISEKIKENSVFTPPSLTEKESTQKPETTQRTSSS